MAYSAGQKLRASQMSTYVCTSGTRPAGHSGQMIYETDTGMVAVYASDNTWRYVYSDGLISQNAEYNMATNQSIANVTQTVVEMTTANRTTPLVTRSVQGAGHRFTLNRAGRWSITCCIRWGNVAVAGERYCLLAASTGGICSQGQVMPATASPLTMSPSATKYFSAGDWVQVEVYQATGGSRTLEFNNTTGWGRLNLTWVGP